MKFTWERIEWDQWWFKIRFADHFPRYEFAKKYCTKDSAVLDIASWTWYGSYELSHVAKDVIGIDVDKESIRIAQKKYIKENLKYIVWDGNHIDLPDWSIDLVVSFETIEHITEYHQFMKEVKRVLKPWWIFILSTPNYLWEIYRNIYHVSNFTTIHIVDLFSQYFSQYKIYYQGKHQFVFPWRWFLQVFCSWFGIKRDVSVRSTKPLFQHHVTILVWTKE